MFDVGMNCFVQTINLASQFFSIVLSQNKNETTTPEKKIADQNCGPVASG